MIGTSTLRDTSDLVWVKSSYSSSGDGNDCVEVAPTPCIVHVRDSKNVDGPRLAVARRSWSSFVAYASEG
ncbi:DUF397 domain-containing protein [Streptomyces sp. enrichment culture]|uniref:DUF397 domain-containing protein n=1 Tax=Streptomyces sp. enrichment culture TaxID=1795815 RepID=UPI003F5607F4